MSATTHGEESQNWITVAREFVAKFIAPRVDALDALPDPAAAFDWEIFENAHACGLTRLEVSRENGGQGASALLMCRVFLELARGDLGIATDISNRTYLSRVFEIAATPEQRERFLPDILNDPRYLLSLAGTEPGIGSDAIMPPREPYKARYATTAVRRDGSWSITGFKHYINSASHARLLLVLAQTDPDSSLAQGSTMFLVPAGTPGLRIGKVHDKLGERCANNAEVILEDCRVPDENIIGAVNQGGAGFGLVLRRRNMYTASTAIGVGEAAYAKAVERAFSRVQGGSRLIDHDTIRLELIRHRMNLDIARTYVEAMASSLDDGATSATPDMFLYPKIFAGQTALSVATSAVEIHGGLGYMKGSIVEKLLRDATQFLHAHGSDRVQLLKAARMQYDSAVVQTGYALAGDSSR